MSADAMILNTDIMEEVKSIIASHAGRGDIDAWRVNSSDSGFQYIVEGRTYEIVIREAGDSSSLVCLSCEIGFVTDRAQWGDRCDVCGPRHQEQMLEELRSAEEQLIVAAHTGSQSDILGTASRVSELRDQIEGNWPGLLDRIQSSRVTSYNAAKAA